MNKTKLSIVSCIVAVLGAAGIAAQSTPDQQQMASQLRMNQEEIQNYSWRSKFTYTVDGVQKRVEEYTVRYFIDGTLQKMQVSGEVDKTKVRRPDGKKLKKKEREAAFDFVMETKSQLDGYLNPLLAEKAVSTATITTSGETLILQCRDFVTTGDSVEIRYELPGRLPKTAVIATTVGGSPASLEIEFGSLEYGPNHVVRSTTKATWQGFQLEIATENSDYKKIRH